jgi:hypothetical protein
LKGNAEHQPRDFNVAETAEDLHKQIIESVVEGGNGIEPSE